MKKQKAFEEEEGGGALDGVGEREDEKGRKREGGESEEAFDGLLTTASVRVKRMGGVRVLNHV